MVDGQKQKNVSREGAKAQRKTFCWRDELRILALALCYGLTLAWMPAQADWAGFSRYSEAAEIAVEASEIRLNLRLAKQAVPADADLAADASQAPAWLAAKLPQFLTQNGKPLVGKFQFLNKTEGKETYYEAGLSYPLAEPLAALTLLPPADSSVSAGLVVLHRGVPVSDLAPLQQPLKLALDWADPWRSRFDNPELIRRHAEPRSYVYVEPYEVRHELLLRLQDLKPWLDLGLKDPRYIEDSEREALKRALGAFLLTRNPLLIDGAPATPQLDRVEFVRFNRAGVLPVTEPGRLDADTVLVGVVLAYLTETPARAIALQWDLFGEASTARQVSLIKAKETFDGYMNLKQPQYDWSQDESLEPVSANEENAAPPPVQKTDATSSIMPRAALLIGLMLALVLTLFGVQWRTPWLRSRASSAALGLLFILTTGFALQPRPSNEPGKAKLDDTQAKALLQSLLHNAYRAFQLRDEEKAYDRLAKSLDGDLLDEIYLQQRRAILQQAQGLGGEGKVDRIDVLESRVQASPGALQVVSRWMAHGTVSHWGHSHERHNLYQARLILRPVDGGQWKITNMEFLGGQRLDAGASS